MPDIVAPEFIALQQALVGRYSLERELGRGGMGIVFLARDVALDRPVAIKLLPPALAARPALKERFLREAQTAAKLSQPNIVPIHAVEEAGGLVYFVMSYIEGETLGERLRARGPLPPHDAARMMREVAWALGYAHGRGVVHRDVKPDNIMIERGTGRAVVMDFGIAALGAEAADGEVMGTAQYISPEQANGDPVDGRSDLYSLGVVTFLALTGRLPFESHDTTELLAMHIARPAPPVGALMAGVPRRLGQAVDRCLAKAPADRFPDGEALAECVAQAIEPERQLPVAVRMWLLKGQENRAAGLLLWFGIMGPPWAVVLAYLLTSQTPGPGGLWGDLQSAIALAAYFGTPALATTLYRLWRLRKLLGEGYSIEDGKLALKDYIERRREELTYEYGSEPPLWAKATRKVMIAAGAVFGGFSVLMGAGVITDGVMLGLLTSGAAWLGTAILQTMRPGRKIDSDQIAELRLKFWNSRRLAKWFEKLARLGLRKSVTPAALTYRPTELAIGLAADALYEALPKEQRRELKELPPLIERLQVDANLMRRTVDELNGALAGLGEQSAAQQSSALRGATAATGALTDVRDKLRADLTRRRDEAAGKLAAAVAALENIRLNLLRLRAGTGSVAELTADLSAARAAQQDLALAAQAREEVEALLSGARTATTDLRLTGASRG